MPITDAGKAFEAASLMSDHARKARCVRDPIWDPLIRKAGTLIRETLAAAPFAGGTTFDPNTVAVCLMLRTITNFEGAVLLAEHGAASPALSLIRACLEDGFVMTELVDNPAEMLQRFKEDYERSRLSQIGIVQKQSLAAADVLKELAALADTYGKGQLISFDQLAKRHPGDTRYLLYRMLSGHAVHCSADSLQRFLSVEEGKWDAFRFGPEDSERMPSVFRYICLAALPTAVEFARLGGLSDREEQIGQFLEEVADEGVAKDWFEYP